MWDQIRMSLLPLSATRLLQGLEYTEAPRIRERSRRGTRQNLKISEATEPTRAGRISRGPGGNSNRRPHAQVEWSRGWIGIERRPVPRLG